MPERRTLTAEQHGDLAEPGTTVSADLPRPTQTLPEQIAEDVARGILSGAVAPGERLNEIVLAHRYGVSRGPIREAIRELTRSGLAKTYPRRGAFVAEVDSNAICDMFNVVAGVMGLAARYCALLADTAGRAELFARVSDLEALAAEAECSPQNFALGSGRIGNALGRNCNSAFLQSAMADALNQTLWSLIYRENDVDYLTPKRRRQVARDWRTTIESINQSAGSESERCARTIIFDGRDEVLKRIGIPGSMPPDPERFLRDSGM